jgi:outer membrane protein
MKTKIALFLSLGLALTSTASLAELKIGVININAVLEKSSQFEEAKRRMDQKFLSRKKQLESQRSEIQNLDEKLSKDGSVMGDTERRKMEKEIQGKIRDAKKSEQEFMEDFNASRNEELGKVQRQILEAIRTIAKDDNFDLLLTEGVIYSNPDIDVTAQVQKKLASMPK